MDESQVLGCEEATVDLGPVVFLGILGDCFIN